MITPSTSPGRKLVAAAGLAMLVTCLGAGCALGAPLAGRTADAEPRDPREGVHLRLTTAHGPVHVFRPAGYEPATAGTVVYVHGYYTDLDGAWHDHHLAAQFENSNLNALFISPEAPGADNQAVRWESLRELLDAVAASGIEPPRGAVVALAHSGGFRTVVPWLSSGLLDTVVLLDGLYGNEVDFAAWADDPEHRLVLVGFDTTTRIERFVTGHDVERGALPLPDSLAELERAHLVFLTTQVGHMELVTEGRAIPDVLRLIALPSRQPQ